MPKKRVINLKNENHEVNIKLVNNFGFQGTLYSENIVNANGQMERVITHLKHLYPQYAEYLVQKDLSDYDLDSLYKAGEIFGLSGVYADPEYGERLAQEDISRFIEYLNLSSSKKDEFVNKLSEDKVTGGFLLNLNKAAGQMKPSIQSAYISGYSDINFSQLYFASKEIAKSIEMPDLFADVMEVDVEENGKIKRGYLVDDIEGEDLSTNQNTYLYTENNDKPLRKEIGKSGTSRKVLCDMDVFMMIAGCSQANSSNFRFDTDPVSHEILGVRMTKLPVSRAFMSYSREELENKLMYVSEEMAEKISNVDRDSFYDTLIRSGMNEAHAEAITANFTIIKDLIAEGAEYIKQNPDAEPDGKHVQILDKKGFSELNYDSNQLSDKGLLLGAVNTKDFYFFGNGEAEILTPEEEPIESIKADILISGKANKLMNDIENNTRKTFFGLVSINNSDEYNSIIEGIHKLKATEGMLPDKKEKALVDLMNKCKNYSDTHKNAISGSGQERYEMVTELYNDLNQSLQEYRDDYDYLFDASASENRKLKQIADMIRINEGFSADALKNPGLLDDKDYQRYLGAGNEARRILLERDTDALKNVSDEFTENIKDKFDLLSHHLPSNENDEKASRERLDTLLKISKGAKEVLDIKEIDTEIDTVVNSLSLDAEGNIDVYAVAVKDKREEIEDSYVKLSGLLSKNERLQGLQKNIEEFYHGESSLKGRVDALEAYRTDRDNFEDNKENIANLLVYNLIKEEMDKKNPDLDVLADYFEYMDGYKDVVMNSHAANLYVDEEEMICSNSIDLITKGNKEILNDVREASNALREKNTLHIGAKTAQERIDKERERLAKETQARTEAAERLNYEELKKEDEKRLIRADKDHESLGKRFGKDSNVVKVHGKYRENLKKEYEQKYGSSPQKNPNDMTKEGF